MRTSMCTIGWQKDKWGGGPLERPIETILPVLADAGFDAAEIWWPHIAKLAPAELATLRAQLDDLDLGVAMVSPYFNFTTSEATAAASMAEARAVLAAARVLGSGGVRCFTGKTASADATPEQWDRAVRCLRELGDASRADGIAWALETHAWNLMDTVDSSQRLIEAVARDNVRLILQPSTFGDGWEDATRRLATYACHVHATNARAADPADPKAKRAGCRLCEGTMDWVRIIDLLGAAGFRGHISIEWFGADPEAMARAEGPWLRDRLAARC